MVIKGKLISHLPQTSGEGKNGTWVKGGFIAEIPHDKFPKKVCFTTWGDAVAQTEGIAQNTDIEVSFEVESREYQGKWFTDAKAFKVLVNKNGSYVMPDSAPVNKSADTFSADNQDDSSLPF